MNFQIWAQIAEFDAIGERSNNINACERLSFQSLRIPMAFLRTNNKVKWNLRTNACTEKYCLNETSTKHEAPRPQDALAHEFWHYYLNILGDMLQPDLSTQTHKGH